MGEDSEAAEDVPGVLIIRIRENLDFGTSVPLLVARAGAHATASSEHGPAER